MLRRKSMHHVTETLVTVDTAMRRRRSSALASIPDLSSMSHSQADHTRADRKGSIVCLSVSHDSRHRLRRVSTTLAASIAASVGGQDGKKRLVNIWPEWSDADINAEKWEVAHRGGKKEEKGKSPVVQHFFEDPDGKIEMPPSLKVETWKRPQDYITDRTPTIVDDEGRFDLMTGNDHAHESELMRYITSQIQALWKQSEVKPPGTAAGGAPGPESAQQLEGESGHTWRPWEHIYAINKVTKGPNIPVYNPHGKYVVKLYWMGCWRKIIVDDTLPFDENDRLLLPATTLQQELWPMLVTKALLKVAALDPNGGSSCNEFGDFSVIQCLTGWIPETIPLQYGRIHEIWTLLKAAVPEFKLPEPAPDAAVDGAENKDPNAPDGAKDERGDKEKEKSASDKAEIKTSREGKEKGKDKGGKDDKKDKKDKDKKGDDKGKEKSMIVEEAPIPEHPEVVVFAAYTGPPKYPVRISVLGEMADASERLRQTGLSHLYPHPVLVTQTRSCPLEPPPPPENIPTWKMIRPRKKRTTPSDEPVEAVEERPIQCVEIASPFLNYRVSPVPIPTDTHRPKSSLERGGSRVCSRPGTANAAAIEETDENAPEPEQVAPQPLKVEEPEPQKVEEILKPPEEPLKPSSAGKEKRRSARSGSRQKADIAAQDSAASPKPSKQGSASKSGIKRVGSALKGERTQAGGKADPSAKDAKGSTAAMTSSTTLAVETPVDPAAPSPGEPGEGGEVPPEGAEVVPEETPKPDEPQSQQTWLDFENFCKCFKSLVIYHKTHTYPCNYKHSDLKTSPSAPPSTAKDKKSAPNTAAGVPEDKSPSYLFVDSLKRTEIVVLFSALSRWNEPPPPPPKDDSKTAIKGGAKDKASDRDSKAEAMTVESSSMIDGGVEPPTLELLHPGLLVAEPYSWKSLVSGQPILRLRTTGTRAAVLNLSEGRHLLRFNMTSPLGYHIHLCSSTQFVFGDEEKVMEQLTKESCRFVDNAVQVMTSLGKCISGFSDSVSFTQAWEEYQNHQCPYRDDKTASKQYHHQIYTEALYQMLRKVLSEAGLASAEMAFAWRAFNFDATTKNILALPHSTSSRPATGVTTSDRGSAGGKKSTQKKREPTDTKVDHWKNREATPDEHVATVKIQRAWRGTYVRKILTARTPGNEENLKVQETLQKAWGAIEPSMEQNGLFLFRTMFKADPDLMTKYPFYKDEWNKISYADYSGSFADQPANTWFVVFREIFYVTEEMLCVPKLYVPIPTCMLRVINNDTGEEIPRVFLKVAPHVYKKNKRGYTFVAEARTLDQPLQPGRWRMRLIGSLSPLPAPHRNEVNSSFHSRELRDYYVPNNKNIILRYCVKVQEDHPVSLQMLTSKPDVYIKLQVLDQEQEVLSAVGKGHVVLPAYIFQKDAVGDEEPKRSSSRTSMRGKGSKEGGSKPGKRVGSGRTSRSSHSRHSVSSMDEEDEKPHKYIIQAQVLRSSWPLSESQWTFVNMLKEMEKNEIKLAQKERPPSPPRGEKQSATASKAGKDKGGKGGKGKDKDKTSRPPSQQFDFSKPNWTLRIVSDGSATEEIEVKKDTERADEIRAMKKAWEDAEPGRAVKAMQSRLHYLNSHLIKVKSEEEESEEKPSDIETQQSVPEGATSPVPPLGPLEGSDSDTALTLEPPPPPQPKEVLPLIDLTPFLKRTSSEPRYLDEEEAQRQLEAKQQEIAQYRAHREEVEKWREDEKRHRNQLKLDQMEMFEKMQAALDSARDSINKPREAYRQKFLEAERKRLEEIAAQEAALRADVAPSPKGRKSAKGKKTPSGKKKK